MNLPVIKSHLSLSGDTLAFISFNNDSHFMERFWGAKWKYTII